MSHCIACWYVAKVKNYQTAKNIKRFLEQAGIEHYVPIQDGKVGLYGLIFIRTDYDRALSLPAESGITIFYLHDKTGHGLQVVPDEEMQNFLFLQRFAHKYFYLPNPENLQGGEKVRVIGGEFAGIEGELYRLKGHKRVVVRLSNLLSVAMNEYIAKENLEIIHD
jgi:hypothetical protein